MGDPRGDRVRALFGQAVELDAAERPAFLAAACGGDATLRDEVESLLACDAVGAVASEVGFLRSPVVRPAAAAAGDRPPDVPGYEIGGVLGRGGMGVVYQARDVALKRTVALKVILAGGHAGPAERARFEAEAVAVARLHHPNIVHIYAVGSHAGLPYVALECVGGAPSPRSWRAGRWPHVPPRPSSVRWPGRWPWPTAATSSTAT